MQMSLVQGKEWENGLDSRLVYVYLSKITAHGVLYIRSKYIVMFVSIYN